MKIVVTKFAYLAMMISVFSSVGKVRVEGRRDLYERKREMMEMSKQFHRLGAGPMELSGTLLGSLEDCLLVHTRGRVLLGADCFCLEGWKE